MSEEAKPKPKRVFGSSDPKCNVCNKTVYPAEKIDTTGGLHVHKSCFKCQTCQTRLNLNTYSVLDGKLYCMTDYKKSFLARGEAYETEIGAQQKAVLLNEGES